MDELVKVELWNCERYPLLSVAEPGSLTLDDELFEVPKHLVESFVEAWETVRRAEKEIREFVESKGGEIPG